MKRSILPFVLSAFTLVSVIGCGNKTEPETTEETSQDSQAELLVDDHSGWWCTPHGVPEHECALCDTSLVADFKAKDDWCEEHDRPDSQCFKCKPELFDAFAARYEAKFGEQPPKPID